MQVPLRESERHVIFIVKPVTMQETLTALNELIITTGGPMGIVFQPAIMVNIKMQRISYA